MFDVKDKLNQVFFIRIQGLNNEVLLGEERILQTL